MFDLSKNLTRRDVHMFLGFARLRGGGLNWGRLEISHAGQFGTVCGERANDDFSDAAATVACTNMGFEVNFNFTKNLNLNQKPKFRPKISIFFKNFNFTKNRNFDEKFKF